MEYHQKEQRSIHHDHTWTLSFQSFLVPFSDDPGNKHYRQIRLRPLVCIAMVHQPQSVFHVSSKIGYH